MPNTGPCGGGGFPVVRMLSLQFLTRGHTRTRTGTTSEQRGIHLVSQHAHVHLYAIFFTLCLSQTLLFSMRVLTRFSLHLLASLIIIIIIIIIIILNHPSIRIPQSSKHQNSSSPYRSSRHHEHRSIAHRGGGLEPELHRQAGRQAVR